MLNLDHKRLSAEELMRLNCGCGEDLNALDSNGIKEVNSKGN